MWQSAISVALVLVLLFTLALGANSSWHESFHGHGDCVGEVHSKHSPGCTSTDPAHGEDPHAGSPEEDEHHLCAALLFSKGLVDAVGLWTPEAGHAGLAVRVELSPLVFTFSDPTFLLPPGRGPPSLLSPLLPA